MGNALSMGNFEIAIEHAVLCWIFLPWTCINCAALGMHDWPLDAHAHTALDMHGASCACSQRCLAWP